MCDTNEHILIGETASSWLPQMLDWACGLPGGCDVNQYATLSGIFSHTDLHQFKFASGADDWASYGDILALSGDYYPDEGAIGASPGMTEKLIKEWHRCLSAGSIKDLKDPDKAEMVLRAMSNWPHFGHDGLDLWLRVHREAIDIAIRGRQGRMRPDEMQDIAVTGQGQTDQLFAGLILALRHNAFGDHYLSDFFSAGHLRVPRVEFFRYLGGTALGRTIPHTQGVLKDVPGGVDVGRDVDIASVLSGISHDEDGQWGLWCNFHFGDRTVNGLDGVKAVSGRGDAPLGTSAISRFFARGDDGLNDLPNNATTRALSFYAVGLSIRDILIASVTGKDPSTTNATWGHNLWQPDNYWTAVGGKPDPAPLYAPLALVPRPLDPDPGWTGRDSNHVGSINHFPLLKPDGGFAAYFDGLKKHMVDESVMKGPTNFTVRSYIRTVVPIPGIGPPVPVTGGDYSPGSQTYFDFLHYLEHGGDVVPAAVWRPTEYTAMLARYGKYKAG